MRDVCFATSHPSRLENHDAHRSEEQPRLLLDAPCSVWRQNSSTRAPSGSSPATATPTPPPPRPRRRPTRATGLTSARSPARRHRCACARPRCTPAAARRRRRASRGRALRDAVSRNAGGRVALSFCALVWGGGFGWCTWWQGAMAEMGASEMGGPWANRTARKERGVRRAHHQGRRRGPQGRWLRANRPGGHAHLVSKTLLQHCPTAPATEIVRRLNAAFNAPVLPASLVMMMMN